MKCVFTKEKSEHSRFMIMMQPTVEEAQAMVDKNETDPYAWYVMGKALNIQKKYDEAIYAYSRGIACDPFYAPNYLGRGCKLGSRKESYWHGISDLTMAIKLQETEWRNWYYRATTENLNGYLEESVEDFLMCVKYSSPEEHYPLIDWIYNTYVELGRFEDAEKSLELIDATRQEPQMHYGYARCVRLFKGMIKPEDFIDIEDMKKKVLPRENRVNLELNGMYYGLYNYWILHGDEEKAVDAIRELQKVAYPGAFAHTKSIPIAKKLGIIK